MVAWHDHGIQVLADHGSLFAVAGMQRPICYTVPAFPFSLKLYKMTTTVLARRLSPRYLPARPAEPAPSPRTSRAA